ncbi:hypothetical protein MATL_G00254630 [Megalops atlanticus]|uniref:Uncharacterized protein n=1 Tax=Megalops atlanticus TaxID=7932 RepID=A0A9D3PD07_MEGAT|nr:hypothetical protein MATL_G00254630 [Megalops atlanticus]
MNKSGGEKKQAEAESPERQVEWKRGGGTVCCRRRREAPHRADLRVDKQDGKSFYLFISSPNWHAFVNGIPKLKHKLSSAQRSEVRRVMRIGPALGR